MDEVPAATPTDDAADDPLHDARHRLAASRRGTGRWPAQPARSFTRYLLVVYIYRKMIYIKEWRGDADSVFT